MKAPAVIAQEPCTPTVLVHLNNRQPSLFLIKGSNTQHNDAASNRCSEGLSAILPAMVAPGPFEECRGQRPCAALTCDSHANGRISGPMCETSNDEQEEVWGALGQLDDALHIQVALHRGHVGRAHLIRLVCLVSVGLQPVRWTVDCQLCTAPKQPVSQGKFDPSRPLQVEDLALTLREGTNEAFRLL